VFSPRPDRSSPPTFFHFLSRRLLFYPSRPFSTSFSIDSLTRARLSSTAQNTLRISRFPPEFFSGENFRPHSSSDGPSPSSGGIIGLSSLLDTPHIFFFFKPSAFPLTLPPSTPATSCRFWHPPLFSFSPPLFPPPRFSSRVLGPPFTFRVQNATSHLTSPAWPFPNYLGGFDFFFNGW